MRRWSGTNTRDSPGGDIEPGREEKSWYVPDDVKRFARNSRREGCFNPVGGMDSLRKAPATVIAEGYATAASIREALGHAVVAAFDAGNLVPVAQAMRRAIPDKPIIIVGDDDRHLESVGKPNVGKTKALEAAAVGGKAVFSVFAPGERGADPKGFISHAPIFGMGNPGERGADPKGFTDFNDLATKSALGLEAVKSQVGAVVERLIEKQQMVAEQTKTREREERSKDGKEISRT